MTLTAHAHVAAAADVAGVTHFPVLSSAVPLVLRRTPDAVYLVGGAAGPLGGDDLSLSVEVRDGAVLRLRTAAASIALPGRSGAESVFRLTVTVGEHARFEYQPEPLVVAEGARHRVEVSVTLAASASLLLRDELILGRHGEPGGSCVTRLGADRAGRPLLRHEIAVAGGDEVSLGPAVLGGHRLTGSVLVVGPGTPAGSCGDGVAVLTLADDAALVTAVARDAHTLRRRLYGPFSLPARRRSELLVHFGGRMTDGCCPVNVPWAVRSPEVVGHARLSCCWTRESGW